MAVIQKLRNSGWVAVVIIVALVLFVVGDWISGKNGMGNGREEADVIAIMDGEKVRESEFMKIFQEELRKEQENNPDFQGDEDAQRQLVQKAWNELSKVRLLNTQIALAGIAVDDNDFNEMMVGLHPNESILGDPSFQTDGKFDPKKVEMIFRQAKGNAQMKGRLADYVNSIRQQELESRYSTYLSKTSYKTKVEKEFEYITANQAVAGKMVTLDANSIQDKDIKVTEDDLEDYLNEYKDRYKYTQEARNLKYVSFDIIPTSEDSAYIKNQAETIATTWRAQTTPDTIGAIGYLSRSQLPKDAPEAISNLVWNTAVGAVTGPIYKDGKYYVYQKVGQKKDTAGFVRASHILIPFSGQLPDQTEIKDSTMALAKASELYAKIKGGADMADLATKFSTDQGSARKGGDLGWSSPSKFVPEFANFCKSATKGQVGLVKTQYGYHIIKMTEEPDYTQIKFVQEIIEVTAGQKTVKAVDEKSRKFRNLVNPAKPETFEKAIEKTGAVPRVVKDFSTDQKTITGIDNSADSKTIMYWLFNKERKSNDISEIFALSSKHVIVKVETVKHVGYAKLEDVRSEIEPLVRERLKSRKAQEKLAEALKSNNTPEKLASAVKGIVVSLDGVRFGQNFVPQLGQELPVLGAIFGVKENTTSAPIAGRLAAAVIFAGKRTNVEVPASVRDAADQMDFMNQPQYLMNRVQEMMVKAAQIQDYRYKFEWYN